MAQVITQQQKPNDSCNVPSDRFKVQFRLRHRFPTCGHKPAGDAHHFVFFHVQPANQQPTITGVDLRHKNDGRPWFTEKRVFLYQFIPPESILNATQMKMTATKHVKISFPLRIYSTLKFTYVIKQDRRSHSDTQTE
jgi:hypothetical protein